MRLAKLDKNIENKTLAITIKSQDGNKLIGEGAILSTKMIERLKSSGIYAVYIEDENTDIKLSETIDTDTQNDLVTKLLDIYKKIVKNQFSNLDLIRFIRTDLLPKLKNGPVSLPADQILDRDDIIKHSLSVAILAVKIATSLGFNTEKIEQMAFIALTHDIGKLLQRNNSKLNHIPHYEIAYEYLKKKNCSVLSYMTIRFQEESYDGMGPYLVPQEKQMDFVKILNICDFYDTLLRTTKLMPYECYEKVLSLVNIKFDPEIFKVFRDSFYVYPIGLPVILNNKDKGIIYMQNESYPLRPIVKTKNSYYNLMEHLTLFIEEVAL
jgi:putative nucleotidyltransferase with HDIG domain